MSKLEFLPLFEKDTLFTKSLKLYEKIRSISTVFVILAFQPYHLRSQRKLESFAQILV